MYQTDGPSILSVFAEPAVITNDMLMNLVIDQGPKGEAGKLFQQDGIKLEDVKEIRIEFLNILNIDHLWVLKNLVKLKLSNNIIEKIQNLGVLVHLRELDLSFNRIKLIENLNDLRKLEVLLLYGNEISLVQGMDELTELSVLSLGRNKIADWEHVVYLRGFPKLRSLNTGENPCTELEGYTDYLFAFIPQLIYFRYRMITREERRSAIEKHYRALSNLEETEAKEMLETDLRREREKKLAFNTKAYVEYLDGDELFQKMFLNDKEGNNLRMVNDETLYAHEEYRNKFSVLCEELFEVGIKEHHKRMDEIKLFKDVVDRGKEYIQDQGRKIVEEILEKKKEIFAITKQLMQRVTDDMENAQLDRIIHKTQEYSDQFEDLVSKAWTQLMSNEATLHDQMEDINEVFTINIRDMVDGYLEVARGHFSQLRNCEAEYNDTINGLVLYYLSGFGDDAKVPSHLANVCGDKDILSNNLAASHDLHLEVIDAREDSMINRLKNWLEGYTEQLQRDENERNRRQILEISHFVDFQRQELNSAQLLQQMNLDITDPDVMLALES